MRSFGSEVPMLQTEMQNGGIKKKQFNRETELPYLILNLNQRLSLRNEVNVCWQTCVADGV